MGTGYLLLPLPCHLHLYLSFLRKLSVGPPPRAPRVFERLFFNRVEHATELSYREERQQGESDHVHDLLYAPSQYGSMAVTCVMYSLEVMISSW